jgi:microcystin-dependent protein
MILVDSLQFCLTFPSLAKIQEVLRMSQPYVGEVRLVGFNFAPAGWNFCDGSTLPISQFDTLFTLIGTTYGGNGQTTFNVPDLRGRTPIHQGNGSLISQTGGVETVTLNINQLPAHTHALLATTNNVTTNAPGNNNTVGANVKTYASESPSNAMNAAMIGSVGGSQPHDNLQPYLALNWIISLFGIFPSQG